VTNNIRDLVILVPDKDIEATMIGLLTRTASLNIRPIDAQIYTHPERDPGCYNSSADFLRPFSTFFDYAMVVFDRHGCGHEDLEREAIETTVSSKLAVSGWQGRNEVVVLDPEIEIWVWSDSPWVQRILGWDETISNMRDWLEEKNYLNSGDNKPIAPKEALEETLRYLKRPKSPSLFLDLATQISLNRCTDSSFNKFRSTMSHWFTVEG